MVGVDDDGNDSTPKQGSQYDSLLDHQDDSNNERFYAEYLIASQRNYQTDFTIATDSHWAVVGVAF